MIDNLEDLAQFLEQRFADRVDPNLPEWEIFEAMTELMKAGLLPPSISFTYRSDGRVWTVTDNTKEGRSDLVAAALKA